MEPIKWDENDKEKLNAKVEMVPQCFRVIYAYWWGDETVHMHLFVKSSKLGWKEGKGKIKALNVIKLCDIALISKTKMCFRIKGKQIKAMKTGVGVALFWLQNQRTTPSLMYIIIHHSYMQLLIQLVLWLAEINVLIITSIEVLIRLTFWHFPYWIPENPR